MHRYYCSYFDRNYLLKALALISSMNRHLQGGFTLYAICLDELTRLILQRLAPPNVVPIPLHKVDQHDDALLAAKRNRSCVEYYWTLTPNVILWILDHYPGIELITYLDADMYFYADSQPVFDELGEKSVLIHEHRFSEELRHLAKYGRYNVGLLCFRRDASAMEVLNWWRERCVEWCYSYLDEDQDRYGDQLYLDHWTERFSGVHVLEHIGAGVAPWNHIQYRFDKDQGGSPRVDNLPVIFYHFHSLEFVHQEVVIPAKFLHYPLREDILRCCVMPYIEEVLRLAGVVRGILPDFSFGLSRDDLLSADHTVMAHKRCRDDLRRIGLNHPTLDLCADWECHCSPQMVPPAPPYEEERPRVRLDEPPRISVVIPSYNYGRYLGACLESILSQRYPNLELIVMDGGSTDETVPIIRKYERRISYWRSHPDAGQYSAIEEGLRRSTGEIMTWLNADDLFHPGAFKTVSRIFSSHPEVEWLMGRPNSFDEEGRQKVVLSFLPMNSRARYLADQELIQQEGVFWRRGLWERSGASVDQELLLAADLELWARFFRSAALFSVDTLLAGFRDHALQKSKDKAGYTAEADRVLAREREHFAAEKSPFNPPAPLPILLKEEAEPASAPDPHYAAGAPS